MSSIKGGAETVHDNKTFRGADTVYDNKTVAYANSRKQTPSGEDQKRTQVYSRVTERDKLLGPVSGDTYENTLGKRKPLDVNNMEAATVTNESIHGEEVDFQTFTPKIPGRNPVFSKTGARLKPNGEPSFQLNADEKMSLDTGFDIGIGERITTRDEDSNFKLIVSSHRNPK